MLDRTTPAQSRKMSSCYWHDSLGDKNRINDRCNQNARAFLERNLDTQVVREAEEGEHRKRKGKKVFKKNGCAQPDIQDLEID